MGWNWSELSMRNSPASESSLKVNNRRMMQFWWNPGDFHTATFRLPVWKTESDYLATANLKSGSETQINVADLLLEQSQWFRTTLWCVYLTCNPAVCVHWNVSESSHLMFFAFFVLFWFFSSASLENYSSLCAFLPKLKAVREDKHSGVLRWTVLHSHNLSSPLWDYDFATSPPSAALKQCSIVSKMQMYGSLLHACDGEEDNARRWRVTCCWTVLVCSVKMTPGTNRFVWQVE